MKIIGVDFKTATFKCPFCRKILTTEAADEAIKHVFAHKDKIGWKMLALETWLAVNVMLPRIKAIKNNQPK